MFNLYKYSQNNANSDSVSSPLSNIDPESLLSDMADSGQEVINSLPVSDNNAIQSNPSKEINTTPELDQERQITASELAWKSVYDSLPAGVQKQTIYQALISNHPELNNEKMINNNIEDMKKNARPEELIKFINIMPKIHELIQSSNIKDVIDTLERINLSEAVDQQMAAAASSKFNFKNFKSAQLSIPAVQQPTDMNPMPMPEQKRSRFPIKGVYDFMNKFLDDILSWEGKKGKPSKKDIISNIAVNEILETIKKVEEGYFDTENDVKDLLREIQQLDPVLEKEKAKKIMARVYKFLPGFVVKKNQVEQNTMAEKVEGIIKFNLSDHVLNNKPTGLSKEASAFQSQEYVLYGPTEKRICPKLRGRNMGSDVVSEYICRHHCLWGVVIDDNKTVCGEALWRGNIMDKYSREYVNEDGRPTGGYLNKRFEIDRNVPEENRMRLKPGETRKPRPPSQGNYESRMQDMRRKEGEKRGYRPDVDTGDPFNWTKDVDQNNINVSQAERDRREETMGHKTVQYNNKEKQENNPKVAFNLKAFKMSQRRYLRPEDTGRLSDDLGLSDEFLRDIQIDEDQPSRNIDDFSSKSDEEKYYEIIDYLNLTDDLKYFDFLQDKIDTIQSEQYRTLAQNAFYRRGLELEKLKEKHKESTLGEDFASKANNRTKLGNKDQYKNNIDNINKISSSSTSAFDDISNKIYNARSIKDINKIDHEIRNKMSEKVLTQSQYDLFIRHLARKRNEIESRESYGRSSLGLGEGYASNNKKIRESGSAFSPEQFDKQPKKNICPKCKKEYNSQVCEYCNKKQDSKKTFIDKTSEKWMQDAVKNKGSFTEYCGGKVTQECINRGKKSPNKKTRQRAELAETFREQAKKRKKKSSGFNLKDYKTQKTGAKWDRTEREYLKHKGWDPDLISGIPHKVPQRDAQGNVIIDKRTGKPKMEDLGMKAIGEPMTSREKARKHLIRDRKTRGLPGYNPRRYQHSYTDPMTGEEHVKGELKNKKDLGIRGIDRYNYPTFEELAKQVEPELELNEKDQNLPGIDLPKDPQSEPQWRSSYSLDSDDPSYERLRDVVEPTDEELSDINKELAKQDTEVPSDISLKDLQKELSQAINPDDLLKVWNKMKNTPELSPQEKNQLRKGIAESLAYFMKNERNINTEEEEISSDIPIGSDVEMESLPTDEIHDVPFIEDEENPEEDKSDLDWLIQRHSSSKEINKKSFNLKNHKPTNTKKKT